MRISDWSSDVCSSDLRSRSEWWRGGGFAPLAPPSAAAPLPPPHGFATGRRVRSADRRIGGEPPIQIIIERLHQLLELMLEEVVGAWNLVVMDGDTLLVAPLVAQLFPLARLNDPIG